MLSGELPPAYDQSGVHTQHSNSPRTTQEFHLHDDDGSKNLNLKVLSIASPHFQPTFLEGQPIEGEVVISSKKRESVRSVSITLNGFVRFSGLDNRQFLTHTQTLWKHGPAESSMITKVVGYSDGMEGTHAWPFSILLPEYVRLDPKHWHHVKSSEDVPLPPTTYSKSFAWDIQYELVVEVKRAGMLSVDDILTQSIVYTPLIREPKPFAARLAAYQDGTPLPGPKDDHEGWRLFDAIHVEGKFADTGEAKCTYTLAIAAPLSYASHGLIHLYLTVDCDDENALARFADPSAPDITIYHHIETTTPGVENVGGSFVLSGKEPNKPLSKAIWSVLEDGFRQRVLYGEIKLPEDIRPSFSFGGLGMQYFVEAHAPSIQGFEPASHERLFRSEVQICSVHYGEPRPKSYLH